MIKNLNFVLLLLVLTSFSSCSILDSFGDKEEEKEAISDKELKFNTHFLEAERLKLIGKNESALRQLEKAKKYRKDDDALYYLLAKVNSKLGYNSEAIRNAEKAVELNNDNVWYHILLSELYQNSGLFADASEQIEEIIELKPQKIKYYFKLSRLYKSIGKTNKAIDILDEAEDKFGVKDMITFEKVKLYQKEGKAKNAIKELEKLSEEYPDNPRYKALLANIYDETGDTKKAEKIYKKLENTGMLDGKILLSISSFYRKNGDFEEAYNYMKKAFAAKDLSIDLKVQVIVSMMTKTGVSTFENEKQRELLDILLKTHPDEPKALTVYSDFLVKIKKYEEARKMINDVLDKTKDKYMIWEQLLYLNNQLSEFKNLYQNSKKVISLFPNQPMPYLYGSLAALQLDSLDQSIDFGEKGLMYAVNDESIKNELLTFLGEAYHKKEMYAKADSAFDKVLDISPENVHVLNNYSYYLSLREEKLDKAKNMGKRLIRLSPNNSTYLDTYGWVLFKLGEYSESVEYLKKSYELGGKKRPVILEHYGDALFKKGNREKALKIWEKALELKPEDENLKEKVKTKSIVNE